MLAVGSIPLTVVVEIDVVVVSFGLIVKLVVALVVVVVIVIRGGIAVVVVLVVVVDALGTLSYTDSNVFPTRT